MLLWDGLIKRNIPIMILFCNKFENKLNVKVCFEEICYVKMCWFIKLTKITFKKVQEQKCRIKLIGLSYTGN